MAPRKLYLGLLAVTLAGCVRWGRDDGDDSVGYGDWDPTSSYDGSPDDATSSSWEETGNEDESTSTTGTPDSSSSSDSGSSSDSTGGEVDLWPIAEESAVVVWGRSGVPSRNIGLFRNIFTFLAQRPDPALADAGILWIGDCDPREDPLGCLEGNTTAFFEMVDALGTIDFQLLSEVDPAAYDVIVADFCGPVSALQIGMLLGDGARVLVLGDQWCHSGEQSSAERANELLENIGASFNREELYNHEFRVEPPGAGGLLEGLTELDAWGVDLQDVGPQFQSVTKTEAGTVLSVRGAR